MSARQLLFVVAVVAAAFCGLWGLGEAGVFIPHMP